MTIKLSDTELMLLCVAATRDDKCVALPAKLNAARLRKVSDKLIKAGVAREVKAKAASPVWRHDDEGEISYALKLTAAGIKAARVTEAKAGPAPAASDRFDTTNLEADLPSAGCRASAMNSRADIEANVLPSVPPTRTASAAPRSGSKIANVIHLLGADSGVTISELVEATGWLPHTTRAALTGLRKRGYSIALDRSDRERGAIYRIEAQSAILEPRHGELAVEAP